MPSNALPVAPPWGMGNGANSPILRPPSLSASPVAGLNLQIPLPEVFPIPDAREFNPLGSIGSAGASTNTLITGTTLNVPDSTFGIIRGVTLYITNMLTTTNVLWSLQIDGNSPQGFNAITIFPRATPFVSNSFDAFVRFQGPVTIQVVFSNVDGGAYTVGASYNGWFWPEASDARWRQWGQ